VVVAWVGRAYPDGPDHLGPAAPPLGGVRLCNVLRHNDLNGFGAVCIQY